MPPQVTQAELQALTAAASRAAQNAYAPYSHFYVGAALLLENGETVTGCNVEIASYRLTSCAEQTAIGAAIARFGPSLRIRAVAVQNRANVACTPCGACRQTLAEFAAISTPILFPIAPGENATRTLGELLPASFDLARPFDSAKP